VVPIFGVSLFYFPMKGFKFHVGRDEPSAPFSDTCDWMSRLSADTKIVDLNLPGTHNSVTCTFDSLGHIIAADFVLRGLFR
jgi:hypothetical protein